jgi:hypothetical protein
MLKRIAPQDREGDVTRQHWTSAGVEPGLWEVLADPIVMSLMKADRITRREVLSAGARLMDEPPTDDREEIGTST